jgi:metal-sulfur cluster biosynthetic enzyme
MHFILFHFVSTVNVENVRDSLKKCMDPEVPLSIVDMGLIYGIDVTENNDVNIKMTMTTKGCPLHETMVDDVKRYAKKVSGVNNVDVEIVWDPPWTMDKMSDNAKAMMKTMGAQSTPAPINYETAVPQGVGKLVKQEDGSLVLANEHEQGFMVNQAIIDFWKSCNGQRKVTELVDLFAQQTGLQRTQVEKEVMQLLKQLHEGGLLVIPNQNDAPNVEFKKSN